MAIFVFFGTPLTQVLGTRLAMFVGEFVGRRRVTTVVRCTLPQRFPSPSFTFSPPSAGAFCYVIYIASLIRVIPAVVLVMSCVIGFGAAVRLRCCCKLID